jgi:hypothetical protein
MSKTTNASILSTAVAAAMGAIVIQKQGEVETRYKVAGFAEDRNGTMKDASKSAYVVLKGESDEAIVINVHPTAAQRLLKRGTDGGELSLAVLPEKKAKVEKARTPRSESKKAKALKLVLTGQQVDGWSRKAILEKMQADLGISASCANTYYQNINSGKWAMTEEEMTAAGIAFEADAAADAGTDEQAAAAEGDASAEGQPAAEANDEPAAVAPSADQAPSAE